MPGRIISPKNLLWVFSALMSVCDQQFLVGGARSAEDFPSHDTGEPGWLLLPSRCSLCLQPIIPNLSHEKRLSGASGSAELFLEPPATSRPGILAVNLAGSFPHFCLNHTSIFVVVTGQIFSSHQQFCFQTTHEKLLVFFLGNSKQLLTYLVELLLCWQIPCF